MNPRLVYNGVVVASLEAFKGNYLVCGLSDSDVERIWAMAKFETLIARDVLIRINEKSSDLFVILEGTVQILTKDGDKLAEVGPGSVLGEMALIDDRPRSAEVVCLGLTRVAKIPAKELRSFMANNRDLGFVVLANLARVLSGRLRLADARIDSLLDGDDPWRDSI